MSRSKDVLKYYTNWDSNRKLRWTVERGVNVSSQATDSIYTAWKSRITHSDEDSSEGIDVIITIPKKQVEIIKASLRELAESSLE